MQARESAADSKPEDFIQPDEYSSLENGPMGPLVTAVRQKQPILVAIRSNRKLYGYVKAVDRHWNMILEGVTELWDDKTSKSVHTRKLSRLFLRGDNVIAVYPNPAPQQ